MAGIAACNVDIFASGGIAAIASLIGSVTISLMPEETPYERSCRVCDEAGIIQIVQELTSQGQDTGQSHAWWQSVQASRKASKCR